MLPMGSVGVVSRAGSAWVMHASHSPGRLERIVAPPAVGNQDRREPSVTLSDRAAQLGGVFGLYPRRLAPSSRFCDLPALAQALIAARASGNAGVSAPKPQ